MKKKNPRKGKYEKTNCLEWFKQGDLYGARWSETGEVAIPAEYGNALIFDMNDLAIAWKGNKAGVIDEKNNVRIPFIYDEIDERFVWVPREHRRKVVGCDGKERFIDSEYEQEYRGYACFTNDGGEQAYDNDCKLCEFEEEELQRMHREYEWCVPENANRSLVEIEQALKEDFRKLQDLLCNDGYRKPFYHKASEEIGKQEERVRGHIYDRCHVMNQSWVHNIENARRISRTNDLLMRAVRKAVKLGRKTQESLRWMKDVPNNYEFSIQVYVHPQWDNDKSSYDYKPTEGLSKRKERERLEDQEWEAESHVWNIIAAMGSGAFREDGVTLCFDHTAWEPDDKWNYKELIMDDGMTWDEGIRFPAYRGIYFTHPFHQLFFDGYDYSMEDLCNINDFRVNVAVKLVTKEQGRRRKFV